MRTHRGIFYQFIVLFFIWITAASAFWGCSVSLPSSQEELPAGGMVGKSVFQDAEKYSKPLMFHGKSGKISYFWYFDGASLRAPADQNLTVDFSEDKRGLNGAGSSSEVLRFTFHEKQLIQAKTTLTVDFPRRLNAKKAAFYQKSPKTIRRLLTAPINQDRVSSVTLPIYDTNGTFYLAGMDSSLHEDPSQVQTADSAGGNPGAASSSMQGADSSSAGGCSSGSASKKSKAASGGGTAPANSGRKDRYHTDPTPGGKPKPAEPQNTPKNSQKAFYCTLSIDCKTVFNHRDQLRPEKKSVVPSDGILFKSQKVVFYQGESVFDVLQRETRKNKLQMEFKKTPAYNSGYIEGIQNLYEFDCGSLSGWMYQVNGWFPNYGCSRYRLKDGDVIQWRYTCDLGRDIGNGGKLTK